MKYQNFFYLHIPRTGGTHFRENILENIKTIFEQNKISIYDTSGDKTAHWCWYEPYINDSSYIYLSLRDPASRLISQFCHQAYNAIKYTNTIYSLSDINKKMFYKWIDDGYLKYKNVQSKSIVYYNKNHSIYKSAKNLRWDKDDVPKLNHFMFDKDFIDYKYDINDVLNNINKINFISKSEDMKHILNQEIIINKILQDLNIDYQYNINFNKKHNYNLEITSKLIQTFSKKEIDKLYEYQNIDSEIYFSNIFTKY